MYVGVSLGIDLFSNFQYFRENRDNTCYPNAVCFANNSPSSISGYSWRYDINRKTKQSLELFIGRIIEEEDLRIELAFTTQGNSIYPELNKMKYLKDSVYSLNSDNDPETTILSNTTFSISDVNINTFVGNVYNDFGSMLFQGTNAYVGMGVGVTFFDVDKIYFSTNHLDMAADSLRDLSIYNSYSEESIFGLLPTLQLHAGLDINTDDRAIFGIKLTLSGTGSIKDNGEYLIHPKNIYVIHPIYDLGRFSFTEGFTHIINGRVAFVIKWE